VINRKLLLRFIFGYQLNALLSLIKVLLLFALTYIRQIRWALFCNLILQLAVVFPKVYNAVPSRDRDVTETTLVLQSLFCNRPPKIRSVAKLERQNNACFAIEKNRYNLRNRKTVTIWEYAVLAEQCHVCVS
jgi:hypothetical protein